MNLLSSGNVQSSLEIDYAAELLVEAFDTAAGEYFFTPSVLIRSGVGIPPRELNLIGYVFPRGLNALCLQGVRATVLLSPIIILAFFIAILFVQQQPLCSRSSLTRPAVRYKN